jgi:hypothetical protein
LGRIHRKPHSAIEFRARFLGCAQGGRIRWRMARRGFTAQMRTSPAPRPIEMMIGIAHFCDHNVML